jgi:hypothetical protein
MKRTNTTLFALAFIAVAFCDTNSSGQTANSSCHLGLSSIPFLTKLGGEGWDVTFAKEAKEIKRGPYMINNGKEQQDSGLTGIQYEVKKVVITLPHIEVNPCDGTGTVRDFHLMPKQVIGFEKNGHLFAYHVWMQFMGGSDPNSTVIGSNTHVIFYDMHGDGVFDAVRIGAGIGMPLVPEWVEKGSNASVHPTR